MSLVTLILPRDRRALEKRYAEVVAHEVAEMLSPEELEYLISELEKREIEKRLQTNERLKA